MFYAFHLCSPSNLLLFCYVKGLTTGRHIIWSDMGSTIFLTGSMKEHGIHLVELLEER